MTERNLHVIPNLKGGWAVRKTGAARADRVFGSQAEAVTFARGAARKEGKDLFVHGRDGMVRDHATYGRDPSPPKD